MREQGCSITRWRVAVLLSSLPLTACSTDGPDPGRGPAQTSESAQRSETSGSTSPPEPAWTSTDAAAARASNGRWATCFGQAPTLVGTPGDDRLRATSEDDVILTRGGDDLVVGPRGVEYGDRICTGPGDDRVEFTRRGYAGDSMIRLGSGSDEARIDSRGVVVFGGLDDDTIRYVGRSWGDVAPGPGDDTVITPDVLGYYTVTCLDLRSADRSVHVDLGRGRARGQGTDRLRGVRCAYGSNHDDVIVGTSGQDRLDGGDGGDLLRAGPGDDDVAGDRGTLSTRITGDGAGDRHPDGPDRIHLGSGDDAGDGGGGGDRVRGGPGSDEVSGDTHGDHLHGGPGDDWLYGGRGCMQGFFAFAEMLTDIYRRLPDGRYVVVDVPPAGNEVFGGAGDDFLAGDRGNDRLDGGPGHDSGTGGFRDGRLDWSESVESSSECQSPRGTWPPDS